MEGLWFQPTLFDSEPVRFDERFSTLERIALDDASWIDHASGWVRGTDTLFGQVLEEREWGQRRRWMYDQQVWEPRLTSHWTEASGEPLRPHALEALRRALSARYGVWFDSVGFNLYRDGSDSVAWHADKIAKEIENPIVVLVSLGQPRRFLIRPRGGGRSRSFALGRGDLLVTGGRAQRDWEHSVPKVARAGARISVAFRYGLSPRAYGRP